VIRSTSAYFSPHFFSPKLIQSPIHHADGAQAGKGIAAVALFLLSQAFNLASYVTAQLDMNARLESLRDGRSEKADGTFWTYVTTACNIVQGIALIAGGALLAAFIASANERK
jgi:hypothetical protein